VYVGPGAGSACVSTRDVGARCTDPVTSAVGVEERELDENNPLLKRAESEQPASAIVAQATAARRGSRYDFERVRNGAAKLDILVTHSYAKRSDCE
jgi:hypothetical protein